MKASNISIPPVKNPTPLKLSLAAALFNSALVTGVIWLSAGTTPAILLLVFFSAFAVSFLIFLYVLRFFIYRKIKLIYKTISSFKDSKEKALSRISSNADIISDVSKEVIEWQRSRTDEIASLKRMETFRKEFLGNVSHELKTPLFNIQGYIHTLLDGALEDEKVNTNYLERASRSVDRLCLIIEDLEAISKLETGELILDQRTFDIRELVKEVFESSELRAGELKIKMGFKEGSDHPVYVYADKERIRQVLVNLIVNSIKYGRMNGQTVAGFYDMDENVLIEITDNGIGMDPVHLPRIFERFYRVDKSRSREQGGTGLGLSIVKHIIEAHKQNIHVRSSYGIGTTFTFTLKKAR